MINPLKIEQLAVEVPDAHRSAFALKTFDFGKWVHDTVEAIHIFPRAIAGKTFKVKLAFNYKLVPGVEFEFISLEQGSSVQLVGRMGHHGPCHWGYHTDSLKEELRKWASNGYEVVQISQTVDHTGTDRRYRYAFVDMRNTFGTYIKLIERDPPVFDKKFAEKEFKFLRR